MEQKFLKFLLHRCIIDGIICTKLDRFKQLK